MPGSFEREDLRIIKTKKNLASAMQTLLSDRSFGKITVNDLCEEALVSRTAFYIHYKDKYDLLEQYLSESSHDFFNKLHGLDETRKKNFLIDFINCHKKIIINLSDNSDAELYNILSNFSLSFISSFVKMTENRNICSIPETPKTPETNENKKENALYTFCAGGALGVLSWIWKSNKNPPLDEETAVMYIYKIIGLILSNTNEISSLEKYD